jgi:hypothetical protein
LNTLIALSLFKLARPKKVLFWPEWTYYFSRFFRFWDGFLSDFAFFDATTPRNPHDLTIEHVKHARQCVFGA